ncbi:MAG: methionyl-tRNA formyltransferase, partial [Rhabdaerophilum sp.]
DTGAIGMAERIAISPEMTAGQLHDRMMVAGADLMVRALAALSRGSLNFVPQASEGVIYAAKITKEECRIDFSKPASEAHNHIRGLSPAPGAFFEVEGRRVKVLRATIAEGSGPAGTVIGENVIACGSGAIRLLEVQPAGKAAMSAADFARGKGLPMGSKVG